MNAASKGNEDKSPANEEKRKLEADGHGWRRWGPYLAERAWGTVREDYSENGTAWEYLPHDHARSRAFRWSEDGLGGLSDDRQLLCFAWSFWNGQDPILKERIFGLTGNEGNHGEDAKEYWWYTDSTPTHSWMTWRYWYPQGAYPYANILSENAKRTKHDPEYELLDTGVFDDDRYFDIEAAYAKADTDDYCIRLRVTNRGATDAPLDVLPTLWFRNTWSWEIDAARPDLKVDGLRMIATHPLLGSMTLVAATTAPGGGPVSPTPLVCNNETNMQRLFNVAGSQYPKDGINDHVVHASTTVNPANTGTKGAFRYQLRVPAGQTVELRLRLSPEGHAVDTSWEQAMADRERDADEFYADLTPAGTEPEEATVMRQAFAGLLWSKQYYNYDVERWLDGDPAGPPPPQGRTNGRNKGWKHLNNADVISMPDTWEYPWYATWDLAFHCVALAHVDPDFAKRQLLLICREWYMHPNGQLPAYEWAFGDVNPPVQAWAALEVFRIEGGTDYEFLERLMHKLVINFTWWVNRKDTEGNNLFEGGFLGLDNIGPIDRSANLPFTGVLEQADGTAWMAMFCLNLLEMSIVLSEHDPTYEDLASKFFEHFAYIATAIHEQGLWNDDDGFFYDAIRMENGDRSPIRARSMVGLLPLVATAVFRAGTMARLPRFAKNTRWFMDNKPQYVRHILHEDLFDNNDEDDLLALVAPDRVVRLLSRMTDEAEFLSDHGLRALSKVHRDKPLLMQFGDFTASVDYEPGESTSGLFGGNSNWRGPIWFPVNYLLIDSLKRYGQHFGSDFVVEYPIGAGELRTLDWIANDLTTRLISLFRDDAKGRRPVFGTYEKFQTDPLWHDMIPFHEYFHGDTGAGLGASHQTGWTALVANLIISRQAFVTGKPYIPATVMAADHGPTVDRPRPV
jgi:hypothetical protein